MSAASNLIDCLIIAPLAEEREALLALLPGARRLAPHPEDISIYHAASIAAAYPDGTTTTYSLIVTSPLGMGRVEAAHAAQRGIGRWKPRCVLLVGLAAGAQANGVRLGDVLIADQILDYAQQKVEDTGASIRPQSHRADPRLLAAAQHLRADAWQPAIATPRPGRQGQVPRVHFGPVASGDQVVKATANWAILLGLAPKLIGLEMEAGGVAGAASQAAPPIGFFMIRGVSDLGDARKNDRWRHYACAAAAVYTLALLTAAPFPAVAPPGQVVGRVAARDDAHIPADDKVVGRAEALRRAVEAGSASADMRAAELMRAVAGVIPRADAEGAAAIGTPEQQLRAAIAATIEMAEAFAVAARAVAEEDARDAATALLDGFAELIEDFPHKLETDRRAELAMFLAHELFLTLIAALLRAGRWSLLTDLLDRHIFVNHHPGNSGPGNVPLTLLATPGRLLSQRGRLYGQSTAPLQVALLHERHGTGGHLAANAPLAGLVDADLLLWLRQEAMRERERAAAEWRWRLLAWWEYQPELLSRAVAQRTATGLALALGLSSPGVISDMPLLRQFLRRQLEALQGNGIPWLLGALAALDRIGTA